MIATVAGLATPVFILVCLGIACCALWLLRALR